MRNRFVAVAAILSLSAGCGSSSPDGIAQNSPGSPASTLNYFVQGPSANGQAKVVDQSGRVLASATGINGHAAMTLAQGSGTVWVSYTMENPVHLGGGAGPVTLEAEVPQAELGDTVGIDAVSTLIARYHRLHPDLSFEQSARAVFGYLGLPEDTNPEHLFTNTVFDDANFYAEAAKAGGTEAFLTQLASQIPTRAGNPAALRKSDIILSFPGEEVVGILAKELQGQIFHYLIIRELHEVAGWLTGALGIDGPEPAQLLESLDKLSEELAEITNQIKRNERITAYNAKDNLIIGKRLSADADNITLANWPRRAVPPSDTEVRDMMNSIEATYSDTFGLVLELELDQGAAGQVDKGLISLFLDGTAPTLYGGTRREEALSHLERSLGFQEQVLNLLVEARHYHHLLSEAEKAVDAYYANVKNLRQQYPFPFDQEKLLLDRGTNLLWSRRPVIIPNIGSVQSFLNHYGVDDAPDGAWRIPSTEEYLRLNTALGLGYPGIDQHNNLEMKKFGFLPMGNAPEIGDWQIPNYNNQVATKDIEPLYATITFLNVINFRTEAIRVNEAQFAAYLVRNAPTVKTIQISEVSKTSYSITYKAVAELTDGAQKDVTDLVTWGVTGKDGEDLSNRQVHMSNEPKASGVLTFRASGFSTDPVLVTCSYRAVEQKKSVVPLTFTQPPVSSLVINPISLLVRSGAYSSNSYSQTYKATVVRANNAFSDAEPVVWTSSDPTVTFIGARLTASRPSVKKTVTITATSGGKSQTSPLQLEP